jgi:hypothetical protein
MKRMNKIGSYIITLLACCLFVVSSQGMARAAKTVSAGSVSGNIGSTVSVPIILNDPTGVGGVSFALLYDATKFDFVGLVQSAKAIDDGSQYLNAGTELDQQTAADTMFYQVNDLVDANQQKIGKVLVAAASAQALTSGSLFNAQFQIKEGSCGAYPIGMRKSIVQNATAGYPTPTFLPVLVGMPATTPNASGYYPTPEFETVLVDGQISVVCPGYTIEGNVTYGAGGPAANGSTVVLKQKLPTGNYVFNSQTQVSNGTYGFTNKPAGTYQLIVQPYNPAYFTAMQSDIAVATNVTQNFALETATVRSGTVTVNGAPLPGVRVRVQDGTGNIMGVFPVNVDGYFTTTPLPPGTYTYTAVYGSLEWSVTEGQATDQNLTLHSITGTVNGLNGDGNGQVSIMATSQSGNLVKTVNVGDGAATPYTFNNLVPAADYLVSAYTAGKPVQYYNGVNDITQHTAVDISAADMDQIDFDFGLGSTATISGHVVKGGSPVTGKNVYAFDINTFGLASAQSGQNGYTLTLPPGSYELFVLSNNKVFYYNESATTQVESQATIIDVVADQNLTEVDIDISECTYGIAGTVTFERTGGAPVAGAMVTAISSNQGMAAAFTGQDGTYAITGLCADTYQVELNPLSGDFGLQTKPATIVNSDVTVDFVIDTGNTLSGTVTEQGTGTAIPGAMLYLVDNDTGALVGQRMYHSGANGAYSISDIPDGVCNLEVGHPDYQSTSIDNLIIETDMVQDIELNKGAYIFGNIQNNTGSALPGATVVALATGEPPAYGMSDQNGNYSIYGLDVNTAYIVMASKKGFERAVNATPENPDVNGKQVDFILSPPAAYFNLTGTVTSECDSSPVVGARVIASYSPGGGNPDFFRVTRTTAAGVYLFNDLPQNANYKLVVMPSGTLRPQIHTNINGTNPTNGLVTEDVSIPCGDTISGKITLSTPASIVFVVLYDAATDQFVDYLALTTTDQNGDYPYSFDGLDPGNYKVQATAAGNQTKWYNNADTIGSADSVAAGSANVDVTLQ